MLLMIRPLFDLFFGIVRFIISLLPNLSVNTGLYLGGIVPKQFLQVLNYLPLSYFGLFFKSVAFYTVLQLSWSIIEWIYKKIPGVD